MGGPKPQLIAKSMTGDPIVAYAEARDTLLVTGTSMGKLTVWDKRMGSSSADKVCDLTTCGEDAISGIGVVDGCIYATYGAVLSRSWKLNEVGNEEDRVCTTMRFRRNDNEAMRHLTHVVQSGVNLLIVTEGQSWSHLINVASERSIKPTLQCAVGSVPSQLVDVEGAADDQRLSLLICHRRKAKPPSCCGPLRRDKVMTHNTLWDVLLGTQSYALEVPCSGQARVLGNTLACCNRRNVDLYQRATSQLVGTLRGHRQDVRAVDAVGDDGHVTVSEDGTVLMWKGGRTVREFDMASCTPWLSYSGNYASVTGNATQGALLCTGNSVFLLPEN